jgi:rhombotail lipoprotein
MYRAIICLIFSSLLLTGCLSSNRHNVSSNLVSYLYPDGQRPNHSRDKVPHLKLPLRVGLAFIPESSRDFSLNLTEVEKYQLLEKVSKEFEQHAYIESIDIIPEIYLRQGNGFETISQISALHDIDVMALVSYDQVSLTEENNLSLSYLTIVGALIVPGETTQSHTFVDTAVFDVKTRKLLFRAPGANTESMRHTALGVKAKTRALRMKTFDTAVVSMTNNLSKELANFKSRIKAQKIATVSYREGYSGGGSFGWLGLVLLVLLVRFTRERC